MGKKIWIISIIAILMILSILAIIIIGWENPRVVDNSNRFNTLDQESSNNQISNDQDQDSSSDNDIVSLGRSSDYNDYDDEDDSGSGGGGSSSGGDSDNDNSESDEEQDNENNNCQDECVSGEKRCLENTIQTCGNSDEDSCLEWGQDKQCQYGCRDSKCYQSKIIIEDQEVNLNEEFTFKININSEKEVYAFEIGLSFDNKLEALSVTEGEFLSDGSNTYEGKKKINNSNGKIEYALTRTQTSLGAKGEGKLIEIRFKALQQGDSSINFDYIELIGPDMNDIYTNTKNGIVNILK